MITIDPGRPFWSGFTAFFSNMLGLFAVDQVDVLHQPMVINNWWIATVLSLIVGGAVYGREKVADYRKKNGKDHDSR
jgi:hypothetical protein